MSLLNKTDLPTIGYMYMYMFIDQLIICLHQPEIFPQDRAKLDVLHAPCSSYMTGFLPVTIPYCIHYSMRPTDVVPGAADKEEDQPCSMVIAGHR
jgi:hypothetical protein